MNAKDPPGMAIGKIRHLSRLREPGGDNIGTVSYPCLPWSSIDPPVLAFFAALVQLRLSKHHLQWAPLNSVALQCSISNRCQWRKSSVLETAPADHAVHSATAPRFNGTQPRYVPASLASANNVYVRKDSNKRPLQRSYDVLISSPKKSDNYFTLEIKGRSETVSIDRLKAAYVTQLMDGNSNKPVNSPDHLLTPDSKPVTGILTPGATPEDNTRVTTRAGRVPCRP
ncbi:hypothetical protein EGW08_022306 [Elysia chlorotica]|uniref:Uncharacterized protein n=1 Tax=Elysia chlorotica TaxID=188477 RepID=A0A3S1AW73_ELYCH|nr:hypothetical protein EGW08_022306 [Elysia chlorotica]